MSTFDRMPVLHELNIREHRRRLTEPHPPVLLPLLDKLWAGTEAIAKKIGGFINQDSGPAKTTIIEAPDLRARE
ncbi:MAG TPA: hypothetical protein VFB03_01305 [Candidatus Saccharimonadales bacterium]|nr:hypothetical protein [Candidatus Saccharimonadales bacterium]